MSVRFISDSRKHCCCVLLAGVSFYLSLLCPCSVSAQSAILTSAEMRGSVSPEYRQELQRRLRQQTEWMARQSAVLKAVVQFVAPSVVHIKADLTDAAKGHVEESGSGVLMKRDGRHYVITNRHVIRGADVGNIHIELNDRRWIRPKRILQDVQTDIAVLEVKATDLLGAEFGDSDKMRPGDFVLAVGSPFGLSSSVTFGIVSARNRRNLQLGDTGVKFQDFIQTDAAIHPGNSGGPLVNLAGEVVGINTAIASNTGQNEGVGFAIPINMVLNVVQQLIDQGHVSRAFLGVKIDSSFGPAMAAELGLPRPIGARITSITDAGPADAAGLRVDDVILKFKDIAVEDCSHLVNLISDADAGKPIELVVFRNREQIILTVNLADARAYQQ